MPEEQRKSSVRDWVTTVGGIISILIAAGGLYYTAIQVRQNNQTLNKQYEQSLKSQARLINVVPQSEPSAGDFLVTVTNRSQEPIYRLYVYIAFPASPSDTSHGIFATEKWQAMYECSQVSFNLGAIAKKYSQTARINLANTSTFDYGLVFTDSTGQTWDRHAAGFTHTTPWLEPVSGPTHEPILPPVYGNYQLLDSAPILTTPLPNQTPVVTDVRTGISPCTDTGGG